MAIQLYDSLERKLKPVVPHQPDGIVRFYNCGLTVYDAGHIGNFRTFVINDIIRRLLELEFGKDKVKYVRNLTDVDDKTIKRAREEGRPLADVTKQWTDKFHADCAALNCLPMDPVMEPTATGHIREQVDMIAVLMKKGNAYRTADGSIYFKVSSFPDYGALSRLKERELKTDSAFAADADEKEDGSDFALWKAWKEGDGVNSWDSPWGRGRPGWHIECSAMNKKLLGETIDLHTGGVDLLFPHHENEIAQSQCCNGTLFSHHWYHSEHLLVDGKKMSKSLGNFYTLDDLLAKGYSPMVVRYALLAGHPRKQLNFTLDSLHAAKQALNAIYWFKDALDSLTEGAMGPPSDLFEGALAALSDDLNIPKALGELHSAFSVMRGGSLPIGESKAHLAALERLLFVLGIETREIKPWFTAPENITALAERRWAARTAKNWATADALRKELAAAGWSMLDGKDGYKLEPLKR